MKHYEALEADFLLSYGIDLRRALWGPDLIGVRRLWSLVRGLPADSNMHTVLRADEDERSQPKPVVATTAAQAAAFFPTQPPRR